MLIRRDGEREWRPVQTSSYADEGVLQQLLGESPSLLPGLGDDSGVVAVREVFRPGTGRPDLVCVDLDGGITICECKLQGNPEMRRKIVGQVLAYAASLWRWTYDELDAAIAERTGQALAEMLRQIALDRAVEWDETRFRDRIAENLASGSFRLVFAVDAITDELRGIVEYLNEHTTAGVEVLAIELQLTQDSGVQILRPILYGQEAAERKHAAGRKNRRTPSPSESTAEVISRWSAIQPDTIVTLRPELLSPAWREPVARWAAENPDGLEARWQGDSPARLTWRDGNGYTINRLTKRIVESAGGKYGPFRAPQAWVTPEGLSLTDIAAGLRDRGQDLSGEREFASAQTYALEEPFGPSR